MIALALSSKGNAYDQKVDSLKRAYIAKHILLKMGGKRVNKKAFKRLQKRVLKDLEKKHGIITTSSDKFVKKPENLMESIGTLFNLLIFLKYKRKYKKVRLITNELRRFLVYN